MSKWSFNALLLGKLSNVLDISVTEIARRCKISQPVLYNYVLGNVEITVQALIKICNELRIPSQYFISEDNHYIIPTRETISIEGDKWKPIKWDSNAVEKTFGDGDGRINWKDVADAMGVTSQKPHDRFLLKTRFPISGFLTTCSRYKLSPFNFLIDPNKPNGKGSKQHIPKSKIDSKKQNNHSYSSLSRRMDSLETVLDDLQQKYIDLQNKYADLQKAHEALVRRIQVNIQNVHNSNIGINEHVDMAAEASPGKE